MASSIGFMPNTPLYSSPAQSMKYQYTGPTNFGATQYSGGPGLGGQAGLYGYNPAIAPPAHPAPTPIYSNSMSPGSWNQIAAGIRARQQPTMFAGGTPSMWANAAGGEGGAISPSYFDQYSMMNAGGIGNRYDSGSVSDSLANIAGNAFRSAPQGTLPPAQAAWPNPGVNIFPQSGWAGMRDSVMSAIRGNEGGPPNNPYKMMSATADLNKMGYNIQTDPKTHEPATPAEGYRAADLWLGHLNSLYPYPGQVATAYNSGMGNVNLKYNPNTPGSTPYRSNVPLGTNVTPNAYVSGTPQYTGFYRGMNDAATGMQFQRATGAGSPIPGGFNAWWQRMMGQ